MRLLFAATQFIVAVTPVLQKSVPAAQPNSIYSRSGSIIPARLHSFDGRNVLVRPCVEVIEPGADPVARPISIQAEAPRAMDEQASEVGVTPLRDATEPRLAARRHLPWYKAQPGGKVPASAEC